MDAKTTIIKDSHLQVASFVPPNRIYSQTRVIIQMLIDSVKNGKPITKEDITNAYIDWKVSEGKKLIDKVYNGWEWKEKGFNYQYSYIEVSKEKYATLYETPGNARNWFKSNLGAAIISGKILAIPIIEI